MAVRATAVAFGVAFGFVLAWTRVTDPDVIRRMLLLEEAYVFLSMASAVATAFLGVRVLRHLRARALVTGETVSWSTSRPERRHVVGAALFGLGWAVADACPGPVAAQLGQGVVWSLFTIAGIAVGVSIHVVRERSAAGREPAAETGAGSRSVRPASAAR